MSKAILTADQVKQKFRKEGKTFTAFAQENGWKTATVYRVLNGQIKGRFGTAHDIAIKLGIKADTDQPSV
jgi:gp16 family phage-associated protein